MNRGVRVTARGAGRDGDGWHRQLRGVPRHPANSGPRGRSGQPARGRGGEERCRSERWSRPNDVKVVGLALEEHGGGRVRHRRRCRRARPARAGPRERTHHDRETGAAGIWCRPGADHPAGDARRLGESERGDRRGGLRRPRIARGRGGDRERERHVVTRTVVSNLQVLAAGTRYDQQEAKEGKPIPTTVVTLLTTPEDAERVTLASVEGQILLVLRNPLDIAPTTTAGVRLASLMGPSAQPPVETSFRGRRMVVAAPPRSAPAASAGRRTRWRRSEARNARRKR